MIEAIKNFFVVIFTPPFVHLFAVGLILFALGIIGRVMCGAFTKKDHTRSAGVCFSIVFLYVISIIAFGEDSHLQIFAGALPFFDKAADSISVYGMMKTNFVAFLTEVSQVFALALTISLIKIPVDMLMGKAKKGILKKILLSPILFYPWYLVECLIIFFAMAVNLGIDYILTQYINETFASIVLIVFFVLVGISLILIALKFIFSTIGFFAKPIFDILYKILFENFFGKLIKKAFLSTIILVLILFILDMLGKLAPLMTAIAPATIVAPMMIIIIAIAYVSWVFLT